MAPWVPVFVPAYAKINLTLGVLQRRADGYHDLASILQTISLHDTLRLAPSPAGALTCETDAPELQGANNLALRAAELLRGEAAEPRPGVAIELRKETPAQGGLGGGSSDAASVLVALNALWGLSLAAPRLEELGARLGSDVPFFVRGGTARIVGRGEGVVPLPDAEPLWLVLAKPLIGVSTAAVFRALAPAEYGSDDDTRALVAALDAGLPVPFERLSNSLEAPVLRTYPAVAAARDALLRAGAPLVRMSGSGPTLYAPFRRLADAAEVLGRAQGAGLWLRLCRTVSRMEVADSHPHTAGG